MGNANLGLIFVALLLGAVLRSVRRFPANTAATLNAFVIWISLPALVLSQITALFATQPLTATMLRPVSMAWLQFALAFVVFRVIGAWAGWRRETIGALTLTAGLGNTSFVGFPLLESLVGPSSLPIGVLVDQPGTFLALSTVGLATASLYSPQPNARFDASTVLRRVVSFPPVVALAIAVAWSLAGLPRPATAVSILDRLGSTLVPIALVSVGFQLRLSRRDLREYRAPLAAGLVFKLLLSPLAFVALYAALGDRHDFATHVTILEAAMAPMITAAVVAEEFGLAPKLATLMLGLGIPLSLATVTLWHRVLRT